jgi:hypothetical protein
VGVASGRGQWAWPVGVACGRGQWAWLLFVGAEEGVDQTMASGQYVWLVGLARGRGQGAFPGGVASRVYSTVYSTVLYSVPRLKKHVRPLVTVRRRGVVHTLVPCWWPGTWRGRGTCSSRWGGAQGRGWIIYTMKSNL